MEKKKILFLVNYISHYRIPFYNELSKKYDITVAYSLGNEPKDIHCDFHIKFLPARKFGTVMVQKANLVK